MLLLDTNIVSYLFKKDTRVVSYGPHLRNHELAISFVTLGELYQWPLERGWGPTKTEMLETLVRSLVVVPYDDKLVRTWARLVVENKRRGTPGNFADSWIAATALRHQLSLVTHNKKHFETVPGLTVISES